MSTSKKKSKPVLSENSLEIEDACMRPKLLQSCPTLCNPLDYTLQDPLSMGFSRQEYRSGLLCPPPGESS